MALGDLNWASVSFAILYGVVSVAFTLWCLAWLRRRWPTHGPLMAKAGRGSYATYLLHPVVLVSVLLAFRAVPVAAELKFVIVSVVAVPVCFAVGFAVTRLPASGACYSQGHARGRTRRDHLALGPDSSSP